MIEKGSNIPKISRPSPKANLDFENDPYAAFRGKVTRRIFLDDNEVLLKAPPKFSRKHPWGRIHGVLKDTQLFNNFGRNEKPDMFLNLDEMQDDEKGIFILRNEFLKYNRYVFIGENREVVFEMILSDEILPVIRSVGFNEVKKVVKSKIGPQKHAIKGEDLDPKSHQDIPWILRVVESMGKEFEDIVGRKIAFKATGRQALIGNDLRRENLRKQYKEMRGLEEIFRNKGIPGLDVCKQYAYFCFPKQGPMESRGYNSDLEYILMEQIEGTNLEFSQRSLVRVGAGGMGRVAQPKYYRVYGDKNPTLKNIARFLLENYRPKYSSEHSFRNDVNEFLAEGSIDMETLKEWIEGYLEINRLSRSKLSDFLPWNILVEKDSNGNERRLVIIDQTEH